MLKMIMEYTLSDAAAAVSSLPLPDARARVDAALEACAIADDRLNESGHPDETAEARRMDTLSAAETVLKELRTAAQGALQMMIGISVPPDTDRDLFRLIKCQQQELLCAIADGAELLTDHFRRLRRLHRVLAAHGPRVHFSLTYQDIMRERLRQRPTARLRVHGPGEPVALLNAAIAGMQAYEDECVAKLCRAVSPDGPDEPDGLHFSCLQLTKTVYRIAREHRDRIMALQEELRAGSEILSALPQGRQMDREEYTPLLERHDRRVREFQLSVERCRADFFQRTAV